MTKNGHLITGAIASIYPAFIALNSFGLPYSLAACLMTVAGANAPDYLEIRYTKKIVKKSGFFQKPKEITVSKTVLAHRGVTHTILYWFTAFILSYLLINPTVWFQELIDRFSVLSELHDSKIILSLLLGYSFGGLTHLFGDLPNKKSIPVIPFGFRFCLNLWNSGEKEKFMMFLVGVLTCILVGIEANLLTLDRLIEWYAFISELIVEFLPKNQVTV